MIRRFGRIGNTEDSIFDYRYARPSDELVWRKWPRALWEDLGRSTGLLNATYFGFRFVQSKKQSDFDALIFCLDGDLNNLTVLPPGLLAYLEIDNFFDETGEWRRSKPNEWLRKDSPGWSRVPMVRTSDVPISSFKVFFREFPSVAIHLSSFDDRHMTVKQLCEFIATADGAACLIEAAQRCPSIVVRNPNGWARWIDLPNVGEAIRCAILASASAEVSGFYSEGGIRSFRLRLPEEAPLLPHILNFLVRAVTSFDRDNEPTSGFSVANRIGEEAEKFIPNGDDLKTLLDDDTLPKRVRAAAMALCLVHPHRKSDATLPSVRDLLDLYEEKNGEWYMRALMAAMSDGIRDKKPLVIVTVSTLLDAIRTDYRTRNALDSTLAGWREIARAPVTGDRSNEIWR
jgi:hypothetical protein